MTNETSFLAEIDQDAADQIERRTATRHKPGRDIHCDLSLLVGVKPSPAALLDISMDGLGLLTSELVDHDATAIITFTSHNDRFVCRELVHVRHTTAKAAGAYHIGCEFVKKLTAGDLRALTEACDAAPVQPPTEDVQETCWRRLSA